MRLTHYFRRSSVLAFVFLCLPMFLLVFDVPVTQAATYPNSIASTGDSITRAFNTGWFPFTDSTNNSWSTGTSTSVNSLYLRLRAVNSGINGHVFNDAKTGAKMSDLNGQMQSAVSQGAQYVTVLMGANDVCTSSESTMTSVTTYRAQLDSALATLKTGLPGASVYIVSIPNIYQLWQILHNNSSARTTWALFGICQSMLANPTSTAQADVDRRARVQQRNVDFNTQLAQACAAYGANCRFDGNAIYNTAFTTSDVSTRDYFHPTVSGQAKLASVAWSASGF